MYFFKPIKHLLISICRNVSIKSNTNNFNWRQSTIPKDWHNARCVQNHNSHSLIQTDRVKQTQVLTCSCIQYTESNHGKMASCFISKKERGECWQQARTTKSISKSYAEATFQLEDLIIACSLSYTPNSQMNLKEFCVTICVSNLYRLKQNIIKNLQAGHEVTKTQLQSKMLIFLEEKQA